MKIKTLSVMLTLVLIFSSLSISASAAEYRDEEYANMTVSYHIDYGYTVNIPTSANMTNGNTFEITASNVVIGSQVLSVALDPVMSGLVENTITLRSEEDVALSCKIYREDTDNSNKTQITSENLHLALFRSSETEAYKGGVISLTPIISDALVSSDYSGTLSFIISMIDDPSLS